MNRKLCMLVATGLIAGLSLFVIGCEMCCNSSQGSGSMVITDPSTNESHKATFSYRVECVGSYEDPAVNPNAVRKVSGRLEYQDHRPWKKNDGKRLSVSLHGSVDNVLSTDVLTEKFMDPSYTGPLPVNDDYCSKLKPNVAMFKGRYRPQPGALGEGGEFNIIVEDNGKTGPSSDDTFEIKLIGGIFDGYRQSGVLAGGNIKAL